MRLTQGELSLSSLSIHDKDNFHKGNIKSEALIEQRHHPLCLKGIRTHSEPREWIMPAPLLFPLPKPVVLTGEADLCTKEKEAINNIEFLHFRPSPS